MYEAIITPLVNVRKHPNADRLQLANACGYQIIVDLNTKENELGILFPEGGQLSHEFCYKNNLYREPDQNSDPEAKAGFFDENRKVRAQSFRGQKSEGYWTPIDSLAWAGNVKSLKEGDTITKFNGQLICQKYYSEKALKQMANAKAKAAAAGKKLSDKERFRYLQQHYDTKQLRYSLGKLPVNSLLYLTEKVHGTSGRTGHVPVVQDLSRFKKLWNKYLGKWLPQYPNTKWDYLTGTRKVVLDPYANADTGFYSGKTFRVDIHNKLKKIGLRKGETLYYEIVGYAEDGSKIMPSHSVEDKELKKVYGSNMTYSYGTSPEKEDEYPFTPQYRVFVYRITQLNEDGIAVELSWNQVCERCEQLALEVVPLLDKRFYNGHAEQLLIDCDELSKGHSELDSSHIKEGVCIRVEDKSGTVIYKFKSFDFCVLEGIQPNYVDPEAIESYVDEDQ